MGIKKGDIVKVISGNGKGKEGKVLSVKNAGCDNSTVKVEGVKLQKRHVKARSEAQKGGIVDKEAPIHISNVKLVSSGSNE